jgi:SPP1 family phage portal protein
MIARNRSHAFSVNGGEIMSELHQNSQEEREQYVRAVYATKHMFGRRMIFTSADAITAENVTQVVEQAYNTHLLNRSEIQYLWDYYKGKQPSMYRQRDVRDNLTAHIVENRANEITTFKCGFLVGKPIKYISSVSSDDVSATVAKLNDAMRIIGKKTKDKELVEWQMVCGQGYRYVVQEKSRFRKVPFNLYTLDPRNTFVIRKNDYSQKVIAGVNYVMDEDSQNITFTVYTEDRVFTFIKGSSATSRRNVFGLIPIIEYPANTARLGCFEIVLSMLDAINDFDCARKEAVEQFVQSLLVLYNCQVDESVTADTIRAAGMILLKTVGDAKADIKVLAEQLDQSQNQTLKDDLYNSVLQIVGMPSQSAAGTSDSSNNGAIILKNGWQGAETRATDFEAMFELPEMEMLQVVSVICNVLRNGEYAFDPVDIEVKFTRRNYEDILSKSQTLITMLQNDKVHPQKAYEASGLFPDTEEAYQMGMKWFRENGEKEPQQVIPRKVVVDEDNADEMG